MTLSSLLLCLVALGPGRSLASDPWQTLRELGLPGEAVVDLSAEELLERGGQVDDLLEALAPELASASHDELLLFVRVSERQRRPDLVLHATRGLPTDPRLSGAWMARGRALASAGSWEEAEALLSEARSVPALGARLRGLHGVLAFAHDRAARPAAAAAHWHASALELLADEEEPARSVATLSGHALRALERYEAAGMRESGEALLGKLTGQLRSRLRAGPPHGERERADQHASWSTLARLVDELRPGSGVRLEWLDWCLDGARAHGDPWWSRAALHAVGDTATSVNLLEDTALLEGWCARVLSDGAGIDARLRGAIGTLMSRARERGQQLTWMAETAQVPDALTLLCQPGALRQETRRLLASISREHPELPVVVRAPRDGDPPGSFTPLWVVAGAGGSSRAVVVGDGAQVEGLLLRLLREVD